MLEPFLGKSRSANHGQRVGEGQWLMQAASGIMLGWYRVTGIHDLKRDFYFRQLWDEKGSALIEGMEPRELGAYAEICGRTLARAHARSGDAVTISAYLGSSDAVDRALADFAELDADQNEMDHAALSAAVKTGRVKAQTRAVIPHQRLDSNHPIWMIGIPGAFGDHPSRRVHNSCRFKDPQISRITTCRGPGNY